MKEVRITLLMISVPPGEPLFPLAIARIPPNLPKAGSQNQEKLRTGPRQSRSSLNISTSNGLDPHRHSLPYTPDLISSWRILNV